MSKQQSLRPRHPILLDELDDVNADFELDQECAEVEFAVEQHAHKSFDLHSNAY